MPQLSVNETRLWSRLMDMAAVGEIPLQGSRRLALSSDDQRGRDLFLSWVEDRGFSHVYDQIGNLFVRREGRDKAAKPLVMGSH
ncbi:Zn-dependent hydrolase, partial [Proteus mirabilis]|nr:Zn-dependent hydrolase [Proteus mirabilis]